MQYAIVLSPLVGRMNCHREVAGVGTDFITLPGFLLDGKAVDQTTTAEIASGTHMLFTELDHAFVNPLTDQYRDLLKENFDAGLWDSGSGYDRDSVGTFNEYMTWAVYDLYLQTCFPGVAAQVSQDWALQNETRGFFASSVFNRELTRMYDARRPNQTIKDICPAFIRRLGALQPTLSKPLIDSCNLDNQTIADTVGSFDIYFSEPMQSPDSLDLVRVVEQEGKIVRKERLLLTSEANALVWTNNGKSLHFHLPLVKGSLIKLIFNYPWKTSSVLRSRRGVDLSPYSLIKTTVLPEN